MGKARGRLRTLSTVAVAGGLLSTRRDAPARLDAPGAWISIALNSLRIFRLVARAHQIAAVAPRVMGLDVASVSLLLAGIGLARLLFDRAQAWTAGSEPILGAAMVAVIGLSCLAARRLRFVRSAG